MYCNELFLLYEYIEYEEEKRRWILSDARRAPDQDLPWPVRSPWATGPGRVDSGTRPSPSRPPTGYSPLQMEVLSFLLLYAIPLEYI